MSDLISRQAAIDALGEKPLAWMEGEYELGLQNKWQSDVDALKALPSAQPERPSEIQDILDYLDTVLHPIVSPEHWNVYAELHDMISTLPSAERRGRWTYNANFSEPPFKCSACGKSQGRLSKYCPDCGARMEEN